MNRINLVIEELERNPPLFIDSMGNVRASKVVKSMEELMPLKKQFPLTAGLMYAKTV